MNNQNKKTFDFKNISFVIIAIIFAMIAFKFFDYMESKERNDRIRELDYSVNQQKKEIDILNNFLDLHEKKGGN